MLTALPSLSGALLRVPYAFMVPVFGGRRWTAFSTGIMIVPCVWLGFAVQDRAAGTAPEVDRERLTALCADDLIDDFLRAGDYRIVAEEGEADDEVKTVADFDDEDDLVTEELAEIYRQQGLNDEACAIYRKLSLRNPEKSVYFAELIDEIASEGKNR